MPRRRRAPPTAARGGGGWRVEDAVVGAEEEEDATETVLSLRQALRARAGLGGTETETRQSVAG